MASSISAIDYLRDNFENIDISSTDQYSNLADKQLIETVARIFYGPRRVDDAVNRLRRETEARLAGNYR